MIAFEVSINGKKVYTAAASDYGTLTTSVGWMRTGSFLKHLLLNVHTYALGMLPPENTADEFDRVGSTEQWPEYGVQAGDEVRIRVLEAEAAVLTPPSTTRVLTREQDAKTRRQHYERIKSEYEQLKAEFGE